MALAGIPSAMPRRSACLALTGPRDAQRPDPPGSAARDRVFLQRHFGSPGPNGRDRTQRTGHERSLSLPRMQRRMRTLRADHPPDHGRGACGIAKPTLLPSPLS